MKKRGVYVLCARPFFSKNVQSVDEVEEKAGMDFFYSLPDSIEDEVEAMADLSVW